MARIVYRTIKTRQYAHPVSGRSYMVQVYDDAGRPIWKKPRRRKYSAEALGAGKIAPKKYMKKKPRRPRPRPRPRVPPPRYKTLIKGYVDDTLIGRWMRTNGIITQLAKYVHPRKVLVYITYTDAEGERKTIHKVPCIVAPDDEEAFGNILKLALERLRQDEHRFSAKLLAIRKLKDHLLFATKRVNGTRRKLTTAEKAYYVRRSRRLTQARRPYIHIKIMTTTKRDPTPDCPPGKKLLLRQWKLEQARRAARRRRRRKGRKEGR